MVAPASGNVLVAGRLAQIGCGTARSDLVPADRIWDRPIGAVAGRLALWQSDVWYRPIGSGTGRSDVVLANRMWDRPIGAVASRMFGTGSGG